MSGWAVHPSRGEGLWVEDPGDGGSAVIFCSHCQPAWGATLPDHASALQAAQRHSGAHQIEAAAHPTGDIRTFPVRPMPRNAHLPAGTGVRRRQGSRTGSPAPALAQAVLDAGGTVQQAADAAGVHRKTIREWNAAGRVSYLQRRTPGSAA